MRPLLSSPLRNSGCFVLWMLWLGTITVITTTPHHVVVVVAAAPSSPAARKPTHKPTPLPTNSNGLSAVAVKIAKYAPPGSINIWKNKKNSYQYKALKYVESLPKANQMKDFKAVQYYALATVFYATYAVPNAATKKQGIKTVTGWSQRTNWLSKVVGPCQGWLGVKCTTGTTNGKILALDLSFNSLTGSIPNEVGMLSADNPSLAGRLNSLVLSGNADLYHNADTGGGNWIGQLGSNMQFLYLDNTYLVSTKGVPDVISQLPSLVKLDASSTQITGALRSKPFATLKKAKYLYLSNNTYGSTIPTVFQSLPNLLGFYVGGAQVNGTMDFLIGMPRIQEVILGNNTLTGTIPTQLGNLLQLQYFDVSSNVLFGTIPTDLGKLLRLQHFDVSFNTLSGTVPTQLGELLQLQYLDMSRNALTGTIPTQLGNLLNLQYFDVSFNALSGSLPSQLSKCVEMETLLVYNNQLTGTFPTQYSTMKQLNQFVLGLNNIKNTNNNNAIGKFCTTLKQQSLEFLYLDCDFFNPKDECPSDCAGVCCCSFNTCPIFL